jgi:hypothetical protein
MMLFLGLILLVSPSLLNSAAASLALLLATVGITGIVVVAKRRLGAAGGKLV